VDCQPLNKNNAQQIANKGGRLRWKIENEGFNVPKNNGYEMEHAYSKNQNGLRIFYILMQIAYIITQLILHRLKKPTPGLCPDYALCMPLTLKPET
jgi:hypothetical protein